MSVLGWVVKFPEWLLTRILFGMIRIYQKTLSRLLGNVCRFQPSCSRYMVGAVEKYGLWRGVGRGLRRLSKCHPWNPGGFDPP